MRARSLGCLDHMMDQPMRRARSARARPSAASPVSPSGRAQQQRRHFQPGRSQQPRGHHAVAAVVAPAAEHRHPPRLRKLLPAQRPPRPPPPPASGQSMESPNRSVVARSQACISAAERTCMATMVVDVRTRSWPEMQSCAASCLRPGRRLAGRSAARWCFAECRIWAECIRPGTPASTLLGNAKLGWLKALNICTSKRSDTCSRMGKRREI